MKKIIVQSLSIAGFHTVELKTSKRYAAICGQGAWITKLLRCLLRLIFLPTKIKC